MRIIVDQDEVLADFVNPILRRWERLTGEYVERDEIDMWDMEKRLGPDSYGKIEKWISEKGFFSSLTPIPGAIDGFNELVAAGHDVVVVTTLAEDVIHGYDDKRIWMRKHFPKFNMKNFITCGRKGLIDADVIIDDSPKNIQEFAEMRSGLPIVFDAPWNRALDPKICIRARGWETVGQQIKAYVIMQDFMKKWAKKP